MTSRVRDLGTLGQAVWLDFLERSFLTEGGLARLIAQDGVTGVTSNPSIFEKAIGHGDAYDPDIIQLVEGGARGVGDVYEELAVTDIRTAADTLRPVYDQLGGADGYVSIEVSPYLADSTADTIAEARRLWTEIDRPNLMIKVPGTKAGVPAVRRLTAAGLNVNITLLFALDTYKAVAEAYLAGLEARAAGGEDVSRIASVASFFVSRIDTRIDTVIDARVKAGDAEAEALRALRGKVAIANAKLAYQYYLELITSDRWQSLAARGARPQRLLWASTSTKDASLPDVLYIDALVGRDTINTIPPKTMDAFRDHGTLAETLVEDVDGACRVLAEADRLGLDLAGITAALVVDGVGQFAAASDALLGAIAEKRAALLGERINGLRASLPGPLQDAVDTRLEAARAEGWSRRLWHGDASLWTGGDEGAWLGWLQAGAVDRIDLEDLAAFAAEARSFKDAVLLGMGGSSLGAEVIAGVLGRAEGYPRLHVLDSSDPGQIATVTAAIDPGRTLFFVSSKSGSTMEPDLLRSYFFDLVERAAGTGRAGRQFVAITDPGSALERTARTDGFARVFAGDPSIGGRYSVLSVFGMVPAAAMGIDVGSLLAATRLMVQSCAPDVPPKANPGFRLGAIIGEAVKAGRNKLTILPSASLKPIGAWLEQLLAESTGKQGRGVVPVDLEPVGDPAAYDDDRLFVHLHLAGDQVGEPGARLAALEKAGQPVVRITLAGRDRIGQEFFRWELATAVAGAIIGIDPFDQPDVEAAKLKTRTLVDAYERTGLLEPGAPVLREGALSFFAERSAGDGAALLRTHFEALRPGGYAGFLAYIERSDVHEAALARMRVLIRDARRVATVAGFGPRFLHSTGQAYKGGPPGGVFLEITRDADPDLAIPGRRASFGTVQMSQALGDLEVLAERGRRWLRVHIDGDTQAGLVALERLVAAALA
ncbi:bifunctional transaldolase/phosoglucose isomerase [Novosphingobium album (ex Liu et al. 2023)]|uniref:Transaldolase n=1 Tax=Novosphingobium album (ex Liu et al. 2023) TaxID=3031130 RepID=A0ABT5WRV7_9SPHN|nr:bifunctional transaldolase/phosoglucose isomerase [Novosphingobium album (ex Liu et al. 2023)]MDE8652789.1 bifunctional transaldolase/phosoglucose isomerase [Novosphingobium album (ex Liu et al. 2023)]